MKKNPIKKAANTYWARRKGKSAINNVLAQRPKKPLHVTLGRTGTVDLIRLLMSPNYTPAEKNIIRTILVNRAHGYY